MSWLWFAATCCLLMGATADGQEGGLSQVAPPPRVEVRDPRFGGTAERVRASREIRAEPTISPELSALTLHGPTAAAPSSDLSQKLAKAGEASALKNAEVTEIAATENLAEATRQLDLTGPVARVAQRSMPGVSPWHGPSSDSPREQDESKQQAPRQLDPQVIGQGEPLTGKPGQGAAPARVIAARPTREFADEPQPESFSVDAADEDGVRPPRPPQTNDSPRTAPIPAEIRALGAKIRQTLKHYHADAEDVTRRSPWGVMHSMLAFEIESQVWVQGRKVNSLGYLCWNGRCVNQQLFELRQGGLVARKGPGLQGHDGQFLAMLAQCGVLAENELRVAGENFTVEDLVRFEQWNCRAGTELTFKLIGLSYYLDTDATWQARSGETWSLERLIQEELKQPVIGAACGGTHRMMGYTFALRQRELEGKPIEGQWRRARAFVDDFIDYSLSLQNPDGSFSTAWFRGREARRDADRLMQTTGHVLEWLVFAVPDEQLDDPRITQAVRFLNELMWEGRQRRWEVGPRGHALHALLLYHKRRFGTSGLDN